MSRSQTHRRRMLLGLLISTLGAAALLPSPRAQADELGGPSVSFGILPFGGPSQSRMDWQAIMDDLGKLWHRSMMAVSVTSYDSMEQAIREGKVDIAFLSGRLALEAVTEQDMTVVAQVTRHDGLPGYRSILLTRKNGPIQHLDDLLNHPNLWRIARGERQSVSGYVVPQLALFLPYNIRLETHFTQEIVGTHEVNYLALANGEVDVSIGNTADLEHFQAHFPTEFARLHTIWQSDLIPHGVIAIRRPLAPALLESGKQFFIRYGRGDGPEVAHQRVVLKKLHNLAGFLDADDATLLSMVEIEYQLAREMALSGQWVSEQARQSRLALIDKQRQLRLSILTAQQ